MHGLTALRARRAVIDDGLVGVIDDELTCADLANVALLACGSFPEMIPCIGAATGTADARLRLHIDHLSIRGKSRLPKHYRASGKNKN